MGCNLGNCTETLSAAAEAVGNLGQVLAKSSIYRTAPWGMASDNAFQNAAMLLESVLSPGALLDALLLIEQAHGRARLVDEGNLPGTYNDRSLDLDILLAEDLVVATPALSLPHPRLHLRRFALAPLAEIDPDALHPTLFKTLQRLLDGCPDTSEVERLGPLG